MTEDLPGKDGGADRESAQSCFARAKALFEAGSFQESEDLLRTAIALDGSSGRYFGALGTLLLRMGRFQEARESLHKSLDLDPGRAGTYFDLAFGGKIASADRALVAQMEDLASSEGLDDSDVMALQYALGKAHDDLREYEKAMPHFEKANEVAMKLALQNRPFTLSAAAASFQTLEDTFTAEFFRENDHPGNPSRKPILIVGMMRSGTTLIEQMLSSHPDVHAGGEQPFWMQHRSKAFDKTGVLSPKNLAEIGVRYLQLLDRLDPNAPRVTDKMPQNFLVLGLFRLAFPNAAIIHARRNPMDTCLSIYFTPNDTAPPFLHDKQSIVEFYRLYRRLMDHWRDTLPKESILDVSYEEILNDGPAVARRLLDFCGLEWNDSVLQHDSNPRAVTTSSLWQVRQPLYRSSIGRWRNYEKWLGPFGALAEVIQ